MTRKLTNHQQVTCNCINKSVESIADYLERVGSPNSKVAEQVEKMAYKMRSQLEIDMMKLTMLMEQDNEGIKTK